MNNIYCWRCGTRIEDDSILGIGQFDPTIGRYKGKGFVAFNCPRCKKSRYQIIDSSQLTIHNNISNKVNESSQGKINIDQVIDFYKMLDEIETVDSLLENTSYSTEEETDDELEKPILQPLDVFNLYNKLNSGQLRRLMILTLDKDNYVVSWDFLGEGLNNPISYDPRIIFHNAFVIGEKVSVIIAHNIIEDFVEPTKKELMMTKRLIKAGKILGIDFLDHIVISNNSYHSYDQLNYL